MWILVLILIFYVGPVFLMFLLREQTGLNEKLYKNDLKTYFLLFICSLFLSRFIEFLYDKFIFLKEWVDSVGFLPIFTEDFLFILSMLWVIPFITSSILLKYLQNFMVEKIGVGPAIIIVALINAVFYNPLLLLGYILSGYIYYKTKKLSLAIFLYISLHICYGVRWEQIIEAMIGYSLIGAYLIYILLNQIKTIEVKDDN
jgi:hypothetical protein